ncbi:hypothetical protein [Aquimarina sp. 2201CG5-10]|uniref:hypothetical protein n=1 Tax=Aquimarina callyspongiae TaxID=3098150 RepID=UPI002AB48C86|nr:hypothetical protein [Aquimarina sp. 2201CG5-10]MDY8137563.1 hypothetical protein [Aquimarina sp. 2201CG5-10]
MTKKSEKPIEDKKEYTCISIINLGSNKNGTAKKSYKPFDKIMLNDKQAGILLKQKKIK